jgi:chaperonin GroEL (HSP60 family)
MVWLYGIWYMDICGVLFIIIILYREGEITKERIQMLIKAGANVVLTTKGIDDMALKYFVEAGVIAVRRCNKSDLKAIAKSTGGTSLLLLLIFLSKT